MIDSSAALPERSDCNDNCGRRTFCLMGGPRMLCLMIEAASQMPPMEFVSDVLSAFRSAWHAWRLG